MLGTSYVINTLLWHPGTQIWIMDYVIVSSESLSSLYIVYKAFVLWQWDFKTMGIKGYDWCVSYYQRWVS